MATTYPTDQGGRISITDAAEKMYGTGSPQHLKAMEMERKKTAANPYMQNGNPYMQAQDVGASMAPTMPDDRNDGPANPPVTPTPVTTVQPTTTRPRTMPNGAPDPVSPQAGGDTTSSDMPPSSPTKQSSLVPIICHGCGQRGIAPLAKLMKAGECACGSDDLDVDFTVEAAADRCVTCGVGLPDKDRDRVGARIGNQCRACAKGEKKGAWESDPPLGLIYDTEAVRQPAKCSNCLQETMVIAEDPAAPMPPCPNCGAELLTSAGATMASLHEGAGDPFGSMPEGGVVTTLVNMLNFARNSPDSGKIPGWFMKFFKRMLLPEEIASGYFVQSEAGGSLQMGMGYAKRRTAGYSDLPDDHPGYICPGSGCHFNSRKVAEMEKHLDANPDHRFKEGAGYKGPPKMPATPISPGAGQGEDPEAERLKYERQQRRNEQERQWNTEGDERARKLIPSHFKSKIEEITAGILASNPSMPPAVARRVATETVERYPKVAAGSRG